MPQYTMSAGIPHPGVFVNAQISSIPALALDKSTYSWYTFYGLIYCPLLQSTTMLCFAGCAAAAKATMWLWQRAYKRSALRRYAPPAVKGGGLQIVIPICNSA